MQSELVTLTPLAGKKSFMFLTGRLRVPAGLRDGPVRAGSVAAPSLIAFTNIRQIPERVGAMVQNANSDEITFFTIDALGLTGEGVRRLQRRSARQPPRVGFQARQDRQTGLQEMAVETGGLALLNTNDFERGLGQGVPGRLDLLHRGRQPLELDGRRSTKRSGGGESARRGSCGRGAASRRCRRPISCVEQRARATMETDLSYNAIPAAIQTAPPTPDKKLYRLPITVTMPASGADVRPQRRQGDRAGGLSTSAPSTTRAGGATSPARRRRFQIPAGRDRGQHAAPVLRGGLQTKKGNYRIVVNVRDIATGQDGNRARERPGGVTRASSVAGVERHRRRRFIGAVTLDPELSTPRLAVDSALTASSALASERQPPRAFLGGSVPSGMSTTKSSLRSMPLLAAEPARGVQVPHQRWRTCSSPARTRPAGSRCPVP